MSAHEPRRRRLPRPRRGRIPWGAILILHALPAGVLLGVLILHRQGRLQMREFPPGLAANLTAFGVAVVVLALIASLSLPLVHEGFRACAGTLRRSSAALLGRAPGSRVLALLLIPPCALAALVTGLVRAVLILVAICLIALALFFLVRLFVPDLGEDGVRWALDQWNRMR
jgi:hypothetical protein